MTYTVHHVRATGKFAGFCNGVRITIFCNTADEAWRAIAVVRVRRARMG